MPDAYTMKRPTGDLTLDLRDVERTGRWTPGRKVVLLELIRRGAMTIVQACERFDLSAEEICTWRAAEDRHGRKGLSVTKLQEIGRHV